MISSTIPKASVILLFAGVIGTTKVQGQRLQGRRRLNETEPCPELSTLSGFDLEAYASKTWYVQEQAVTTYLPEFQNYCVTADCTVLEEPTWPWKYTVEVNNRAQDADGNKYGGTINAAQTDPEEEPGKLMVAPGFLPRFFAGPYWVLAYDEEEEGEKDEDNNNNNNSGGYALVIGGQPSVRTEAGCKTQNRWLNSSGGLWIFTRKSERDNDLVNRVREIAANDFGLDVTGLNTVVQGESCDYSE